MSTLIIHYLEQIWVNSPEHNKNPLRHFVEKLYEKSQREGYTKVIVTRSSEFFIEDAFSLFEEFGFDYVSYGEDNFVDCVEEGYVEGTDYLPHPFFEEKVIMVNEWMRQLHSYGDIRVICKDPSYACTELCHALKHTCKNSTVLLDHKVAEIL